ncbi:hypothetical protein [Thauera sp.]|uniref:DUF7220 family protein n=1 Tax=Thauera sp. TaxID=1905334 RepID=UPI0039E6F524
MPQTRRHSALEAIANVAIGYGIAVATQAAVFPLFGLHASAGQHLAIGLIFTAVSLARSYALRRLFNRIR